MRERDNDNIFPITIIPIATHLMQHTSDISYIHFPFITKSMFLCCLFLI